MASIDISANVPPFVLKLRALLDSECSKALRWTDDGTTLTVDEGEVVQGVLQDHFQTFKVKSFIRQLHLHGFKQLRQAQNGLASLRTFVNDNFKRHAPELMTSIRRRVKRRSNVKRLNQDRDGPRPLFPRGSPTRRFRRLSSTNSYHERDGPRDFEASPTSTTVLAQLLAGLAQRVEEQRGLQVQALLQQQRQQQQSVTQSQAWTGTDPVTEYHRVNPVGGHSYNNAGGLWSAQQPPHGSHSSYISPLRSPPCRRSSELGFAYTPTTEAQVLAGLLGVSPARSISFLDQLEADVQRDAMFSTPQLPTYQQHTQAHQSAQRQDSSSSFGFYAPHNEVQISGASVTDLWPDNSVRELNPPASPPVLSKSNSIPNSSDFSQPPSQLTTQSSG